MTTRITSSTLVALLALAIFQTVWRGYTFANSDHAVQIPFLKQAIDPSLYPDDTMMGTSDRYVSYHPRLLAWLVRIFGDMEKIFFAIHIMAVFLTLLLIYQLSLLLFRDQASAALCVMLMLPKRLVLGKGAIYLGGMYPSFVTLPLALLAILLFLKKRRVIAFGILGIVANFQMLVAFYAVCMLGACLLAESLGRFLKARDAFDWKRDVLKGLLLPVGAYLICASPVLFWSARSYTPITAEWIELLRIRSSHHSFPLSWKTSLFVDYLMLLALGALAVRYKPEAALHRRVVAFVGAVAVLCGLGVVFAEWLPVQFVLRGQFFRSTVYLTIFCMIYLSHTIRRRWDEPWPSKLSAVLLFVVVLLPGYYPLAPIALLVLAALEWKQGGRHPGLFAFVLLVLAIRGYAAHTVFPSKLDLQPIGDLLRNIMEDRLLFFSLMFAGLSAIAPSISRRWGRIGLPIALLGFILLLLLPATFQRFHPSDRHQEPWRTVQLWAKQNTPHDTIFLTPPYREGFRIFSERGIVGDWKDGTQQYFDINYAYEWWKRMQDMGGRGQGYDSLPWEQYAAVAERYGASYLVLPKDRDVAQTPVYANASYAVYRLTRASSF